MAKQRNDERTTVMLTSSDRVMLERMAEAESRSLSGVVRRLIRKAGEEVQLKASTKPEPGMTKDPAPASTVVKDPTIEPWEESP